MDFTEEQYRALIRLTATLAKVLPIPLEAPRNADGTIRNAALSAAEFDAFAGVLGHFHVQTNKQDPGPAFQWDRVLSEAQALVDETNSGGLSPVATFFIVAASALGLVVLVKLVRRYGQVRKDREYYFQSMASSRTQSVATMASGETDNYDEVTRQSPRAAPTQGVATRA